MEEGRQERQITTEQLAAAAAPQPPADTAAEGREQQTPPETGTELAPTHLELEGWITTAWDLANAVARIETQAMKRA